MYHKRRNLYRYTGILYGYHRMYPGTVPGYDLQYRVYPVLIRMYPVLYDQYSASASVVYGLSNLR